VKLAPRGPLLTFISGLNHLTELRAQYSHFELSSFLIHIEMCTKVKVKLKTGNA